MIEDTDIQNKINEDLTKRLQAVMDENLKMVNGLARIVDLLEMFQNRFNALEQEVSKLNAVNAAHDRAWMMPVPEKGN
jgi:predicted nuclease with TOPRIM domain